MLKIKDIEVSVDDKIILNGFNLDINDGEIVAVMGPNGVGKSTLSRVIMADKNYHLLKGDIIFNGKVINDLKVDERAKLGIFLAMQNPTVIEGVSNQDFLKTAISSVENKHVGLYDFIKRCENACKDIEIDSSFIHRNVNEGFSGGEKKKNEILQLKLLKPSFIILDEIDSGLDVDSLKVVANNLKKYQEDNPKCCMLIITHYPMLFEYLKPDRVNILSDGKIVRSGGYELALDVFENGFNKYVNIMSEDDEIE